MSDVKIQAARNAQSQEDKASVLDKLIKKPRRTRELAITIGNETLNLTFRALSAKQMDDLQAKYPPTTDQLAQSFRFNPDTFAPALVAATLIDPEITLKQAQTMWESEEWSTGELSTLFDTASSVCMEGVDIPFTGNA